MTTVADLELLGAGHARIELGAGGPAGQRVTDSLAKRLRASCVWRRTSPTSMYSRARTQRAEIQGFQFLPQISGRPW